MLSNLLGRTGTLVSDGAAVEVVLLIPQPAGYVAILMGVRIADGPNEGRIDFVTSDVVRVSGPAQDPMKVVGIAPPESFGESTGPAVATDSDDTDDVTRKLSQSNRTVANPPDNVPVTPRLRRNRQAAEEDATTPVKDSTPPVA